MQDEVHSEALSIRSDPARFREARAWVTRVVQSAGLGQDEVLRVSLAMSEACANAYDHAYGGNKDGRIDLQVEVKDGFVRVTVRDYGTAFNHSAYLPPELTELPEDGYGIYLIQELMDDVTYTNMGIGTRVVMVKRRRPVEVAS